MISQPGRPQGPPGLGDLDDAVGDVGDLGLARAVPEAHVGLDTLVGEVPSGRAAGYSVDTRTPLGSLRHSPPGSRRPTATTTRTGLDVAFE